MFLAEGMYIYILQQRDILKPKGKESHTMREELKEFQQGSAQNTGGSYKRRNDIVRHGTR